MAMDRNKGTERNDGNDGNDGKDRDLDLNQDLDRDLDRAREQRGSQRHMRSARGASELTEEEQRRHLFQEDEPRSAQEEQDRYEQDYEV